MDKKIFSVDFDNTIFTEVYPGIGELIPGARDVINWLHSLGHTIVINTCREGIHAEVAMAALNQHGIKWDYFNTNDPERVELFGHDSRKIGCDVSIDDRDIHVKSSSGIVDWASVRYMLHDYLFPKKKVICIVGESGSGKTYLAEHLRHDYNIPMIESYTDRPKRRDNEVGHVFLSVEEFDELNMADMIAFTCWRADDGSIARYCCLQQDVYAPVMTYVIDERGLKYLKRYWSHKFSIFAVRLFAEKHERLKHIDIERYSRDEGMFNMASDWFDYFIHNDYSEGILLKYDNLFLRL